MLKSRRQQVVSQALWNRMMGKRQKSVPLEKAKEIILKLIQARFPGGATLYKVFKELDDEGDQFISEAVVKKAINALEADKKIKGRNLGNGRGMCWSVAKEEE